MNTLIAICARLPKLSLQMKRLNEFVFTAEMGVANYTKARKQHQTEAAPFDSTEAGKAASINCTSGAACHEHTE
jgi:hypothetical protein